MLISWVTLFRQTGKGSPLAESRSRISRRSISTVSISSIERKAVGRSIRRTTSAPVPQCSLFQPA